MFEALSQLVEEHGLWEIHQALALLWQDQDMILDPPHREHQASWSVSVPSHLGIAKEVTYGAPVASSTFLPIAGGQATATVYNGFTPLDVPSWLGPVLEAEEEDE
jgi:hypothetical protein